MWLPVFDRLAAERDVIAIDLPGFGFSPMPPPGTPAGLDSLAGLVTAFLDELGLDRPHVAGNSLGGLIALELARRGRVASATGISPVGFTGDRDGRFARVSLAAAVRAVRSLRPWVRTLAPHAWIRRAALFQLAAHPERMDPYDAIGNLHALADAPWFDETLETLFSTPFTAGGPLGVPVTVAWGEHDRLLLPRQADRARLELPDARFVTLTGCGHVPTYDDPAQVAEVVLAGSAGR